LTLTPQNKALHRTRRGQLDRGRAAAHRGGCSKSGHGKLAGSFGGEGLVAVERRSVLSKCRKYRYALWREIDPANPSYALFIGLNPSTAD
jgi:hypothetical protein